MFIEYDADDFGYQFWNKQNQKIIRSKDIIFHE